MSEEKKIIQLLLGAGVQCWRVLPQEILDILMKEDSFLCLGVVATMIELDTQDSNGVHTTAVGKIHATKAFLDEYPMAKKYFEKL